MSVVYATSLKTTRMQAVRDALDAGAGPATLEIGITDMAAVLVSITLDDPASSVSGAVLTMLGLPNEGTATASGTAVVARLKDSAANIVVSGLTVGVSAADILISNTNIAINDIVRVNSGTITHG